jgi:hypothetical protein
MQFIDTLHSTDVFVTLFISWFDDDDFWCLTLLVAIFQLYHGDQF